MDQNRGGLLPPFHHTDGEISTNDHGKIGETIVLLDSLSLRVQGGIQKELTMYHAILLILRLPMWLAVRSVWAIYFGLVDIGNWIMNDPDDNGNYVGRGKHDPF